MNNGKRNDKAKEVEGQGLSGNKTAEKTKGPHVVILEPSSFDDSHRIADFLSKGHPVIANYETTGLTVKVRVQSFLRGIIYALHGNIQIIGDDIEIYTPWDKSIENEESSGKGDMCDSCRDALPAKIKIVGVGCGGISCMNRMVACGVQGVEYIAVDCDAQVLRSSRVQNRIQIGKQLTEGLGAGSRPEVGWIAAEKSRDEMLEQLSGADIVCVVAGMGGGAGSGAAPVVAECARETGALTVGFVARPFHFEGRHRMSQADCAIEKMKAHVDALITIPNDQLLQAAEAVEEPPVLFHSAFADALRLSIQGITDIIAVPGLINADVDDVKMLLAGTGTVSMGIGTARGDDAAAEAAKTAVRNASVKGAGSVLFNITGGNNLSLYDAAGASDIIIENVDPDVSVVFGVIIDDKLEDDEVRVSCYFIPGVSC